MESSGWQAVVRKMIGLSVIEIGIDIARRMLNFYLNCATHRSGKKSNAR